MNALAQLGAATTALAQAKTLEEVKRIRDIAQAAHTYAQAAKLGLEAQNHAAEIKLRAERKAGELLAQLKEQEGPAYIPRPGRANQKRLGNVAQPFNGYVAVLDETGTTRRDANTARSLSCSTWCIGCRQEESLVAGRVIDLRQFRLWFHRQTIRQRVSAGTRSAKRPKRS